MVSVGAATHPGRVRSSNEDYLFHGPVPQGYVGIVCDGMGGHEAGEVAARLAAEAVYDFLREAQPTDDLEGLLRDAILAANHRILLHTHAHAAGKAPGSTIVVVLLTQTHLIHGHVGDSRLYAYTGGDLLPLTQDDSLVHQMLSSGLITPEQALHHPQKSVLTQSLGQQPAPTPHVARQPLRKGAIYLLCTDGLSGALSREEIIATLSRSDLPSLQTKAEALIQQANENGGYDNITVLLLQPPAKSPTFAERMNLKLPPQKYLIGGGIAILVVLILVLVFLRGRSTPRTDATGEIIIMDDTKSVVDSALAMNDYPEAAPAPVEEAPVPMSPLPASPPTELPSAPESRAATKPARSATSSQTPSEGKATGSEAKKSTFDYTIQKGDNLRKIAEIFGVSLSELRQVNALKDDNIQAGKKLRIPVKAVHTHTVREKETLSGIARRYDTRIEAIKRANGLEDEKIRQGQKLVIPVVKK